MKSNMMQKRASKKVALNDVSEETIQQAIEEANALVNELPIDDPRVDAIGEIEARLRSNSGNALADVQQLAQFRRALRGQRPEAGVSAEVEASGSDNWFMTNEHPKSVERDKEAATNGADGFVTDRDENGEPKAPERLEVPRLAADEKTAVAPPGWEGTVKEMKKHPEIDNPWALSWSMKNKGYQHHAALEMLQKKGAAALMEAALSEKTADTADNAASEKDAKGAILPKTDAEIKDTQGDMPAQKKDVTASAKTAQPAPPPAPAADANIFNSWTSDCLAAAIKAVTSTAEYASDKAAQAGVGMMNTALSNRPAMPEQPVTASAKKADAGTGFAINNGETGVILEGDGAQGPGDKPVPSSHDHEERQGLDHSGKITKPETKLPGSLNPGKKFAGDEGVKRLMASLKLAGAAE